MNIIIYNINSFGGNYEYAKYLYEAYKQNALTGDVFLIMPQNADYHEPGTKKLLLSDLIQSNNKLLKKIYYLYRSLVNPFRLFFYLKKQPPSTVIFNDFDQITAWFWAPFFKLLKKRHLFSTILHDPDRDKFFPVLALSNSSMSAVMSFMDVAFYHGFLPKKGYYPERLKKVDIPHGIYNDVDVNETAYDNVKKQAAGQYIIGILGNIRDEKNYDVVIDTLVFLQETTLLVAGKAANSGVSTTPYKRQAASLKVENRIIWNEGYLSQPDFNASILACDIILLYYKPTFTSQSGILNTIAPFKKKLIISDAESSLKQSVETYGLGRVVPHDNPTLLAKAVQELLSLDADKFDSNWNNYILNSSWDKHVSIALDAFNKLR
jgi:glycosyltransferase involved in cell wall biosynthesis